MVDGDKLAERALNGASMAVAVLVPFLSPYLADLRARLGEGFDVKPVDSSSERDAFFLERADVVVTNRWTADVASQAKRVGLIQVSGAGTDKLDFSLIPAGVRVANCFGHERAIAEWTLMSCLALSRSLVQADAALRRSQWHYGPGFGHPFVRELAGRTIGIVGFGRSGQEVARLAQVMGMRAITVTRSAVSREVRAATGVEWVGTGRQLSPLLQRSDFVLLAVPLTEATRGMIGATELATMRADAYLLNPARAELIDQQALFRALSLGHIAGAALDVWWHYPPPVETSPADYPFSSLPNVILTPHLAGATEATISRRIPVIADNIKSYRAGRPLAHSVSHPSAATHGRE